MKELMESENISRAELVRRMNLSRARITQMMNQLKLSPEVIEMIKGLGDNFKRPVITDLAVIGGLTEFLRIHHYKLCLK
jgi:transcriptional regulator with XRE-family HTH domain